MFTLNFAELPVAGGQLTLTGSARDAVGNQSLSSPVTVSIRDVVAPAVQSVVPADAATGVELATAVVITFSEPMDRATLTASAIGLTAGNNPVAASLLIAADDRSVTLTPASPLAINTLYTVTVAATARDRAANPLAAPFVSTFRTTAPDAISPKVAAVDPQNGAVGVGTTAPISVTFTEAIAVATVTPASFRVTISAPQWPAASASQTAARRCASRQPAELPFDAVVVTELTGGITDLANNPLVNADGSPIITPITFTYLTGQLRDRQPDRCDGCRGHGGHARSTRRFVADGRERGLHRQRRGAARRHVRSRSRLVIRTPLAATTPTMTVVASARNASNAEIARAERTYDVLAALRATPSVIGLDRGAAGVVRFSLAEPAAADLPITLERRRSGRRDPRGTERGACRPVRRSSTCR